MKCKKCKRKYDDSELKIAGQQARELLEDIPGFNREFMKNMDNNFSLFLRLEHKIDGVKGICMICYIDFWDEFWQWMEDQKTEGERIIRFLRDKE
ncbi:MAG: hypothetical protein ACTSSP_09820 [Candidatus Asgardarchaeia archaeon]